MVGAAEVFEGEVLRHSECFLQGEVTGSIEPDAGTKLSAVMTLFGGLLIMDSRLTR